MQFSSKLAMRVLPVLKRYYELNGKTPELISIGIAAYILFMRPVKKESNRYYGILNNEYYVINDDCAHHFYGLWDEGSIDQIVYKVLSNNEIWAEDLSRFEGFVTSVSKKLKGFIRHGTQYVIAAYSNPVL
jgi:tagaturonate reductase